MTFRKIDEVPSSGGDVRLYAEGWQSWSPTSWLRPGTSFAPDQAWEHAMRFRPGTPLPAPVQGLAPSAQAEGLLVVDPGNGQPVRGYGSAEARTTVASLRAVVGRDMVEVWADEAVRTWATQAAPVAALAAYGEQFAADAGVRRIRTPPRVWCSWYHYFEQVTASDIEEGAASLQDHELPVDVVQIDDGWSRGLGERLDPSSGFPDLAGLIARVRDAGFRVGIWLAPFVVGAHTTVAREHPDWLTGDAGRNWGQPLRGLDLTHPEVREYLHRSVSHLRRLGVDYLKLDFLYAGALPGPRHADVSPVAAYRSGLELIREAAGPEAYLLACGAPILPSVGLVDAMRVSPDTFHEGGEDGSRGLRGRMSLVARAWQHGRFWTNDPDCLVVRPSYRLREEWARTVRTFGGLRSCSDRIADLDDWGLEQTLQLLADDPATGPFGEGVTSVALEEAR